MKLSTLENFMAAVAFAEAGEQETAIRMLKSDSGMKRAEKAEPAGHKNFVVKVIFFGALSLIGYIEIFTNQGWITSTFTKGGINTLWPIGAAFIFSFIHGTFASNFLSLLGLEPKNVTVLTKIKNNMAAVAFAEAGEHETAVRMIESDSNEENAEDALPARHRNLVLNRTLAATS